MLWLAITVTALFVIGYLWLVIWLTRIVARSAMFEPAQKRMQYMLLWCFPIFGPILVMGVVREDMRDKSLGGPMLEILGIEVDPADGIGFPHAPHLPDTVDHLPDMPDWHDPN